MRLRYAVFGLLAACGSPGGDVSSASSESSGTGTSGGWIPADATGATDDGCTTYDCDWYPEADPCRPGVSRDCDAGEKCTPYRLDPEACCVDALECVPLIGDANLGAPCDRTTMNDDCGDTLFCMPAGGTSGTTGPGVCLQLCDIAAPDACAAHGLPEARCISFQDGVLPLCVGDCDPLDQDCGAGLGCYDLVADFTACVEPGALVDGDECDHRFECAPGLRCHDAFELADCAGDRCCTAWCDALVSDPTACPHPEEECVAEPGEALGTCALPS